MKLKGDEDPLHKIYNIDDMLPEVGYISSHLKKAILLEDLITVDVPLCKLFDLLRILTFITIAYLFINNKANTM